ncbi:hypothetical protein [Scytonema sp. PRP1]|uniref:hypothetical protein n=1 Tax=Scytonema sp. PRP1 TaxID=3120513 RepID=UPI002FCF51F1
MPTLESDAAQMTIQQPLIHKGAIAAELLLGDADLITSKVLQTKLVVRESSGPAPIQLR